jgi:hypothetical protein
MGVGTGVQHDPDSFAPCSVDGLHERPFVVGLEAFDVQSVCRPCLLGELFDVGEGSRVPSRFRFGPLRTRMVPRLRSVAG